MRVTDARFWLGVSAVAISGALIEVTERSAAASTLCVEPFVANEVDRELMREGVRLAGPIGQF